MELLTPEYGLIIYQSLAFVLVVGLIYLTYKLVKHFFNLEKETETF